MLERSICIVVDEFPNPGTSAIYRVCDLHTKEEFVAKIPRSLECTQTVVEQAILSGISHPSIIELKGTAETRTGPALLFPFYRCGDLLDLVLQEGPLPEKAVRVIASRLLGALAYLHARGIVHRDLKPDNVFLASGDFNDIVLADFGLACVLPVAEGPGKAVGSPNYVGPEIWEGGGLTEKVDIWALGVTVYGLLLGGFPYVLHPGAEPIDLIREAMLELSQGPVPDGISKECWGVLLQMLTIDPAKRIGAAAALGHAWFTTHSSRPKENSGDSQTPSAGAIPTPPV
jgi:calcium-dependent protein kinase